MRTHVTLPLMPLLLLVGAFPALAQAPVAMHPKPAASAAKPDTDRDEEKNYPSQATVAAKSAFGTVPAASPAVKKALESHALAAQPQIGHAGAFQGTVSKVYVPRNNGMVVLDFDPDYHTALTAVVKPEAYAKFPDMNGLLGKRVMVQGKFSAYHDRPQIEMTDPKQVKVIAGK